METNENADLAKHLGITPPEPVRSVTEPEVEAEIKAKNLTEPRLTPADIDLAIRSTRFHVFGGTLTVCCLTLRNGFMVTGESACASPLNFDAELGRKIAFTKAREKVWPLEGYLLREKLAGA